VLQFIPDRNTVSESKEGWRLLSDVVESAPICVRVNNLGAEERTATLHLHLPDSLKTAEGETSTIKIPPQKFTDMLWHLKLTPAALRAWSTLQIRADSDDQTVVAPLSLDFIHESSLSQLIEPMRQKTRLPIDQLDLWEKKVDATGQLNLSSEEGGVLRMDAEFGSGSPWVFPRFTLPSGLNMSHAEFIVMRAKCKEPAKVKIFAEDKSGTLFGWAAGSFGLIPADNRWHTIRVRLSDLPSSGKDPRKRLDTQGATKISVGFNNNTENPEKKNTLWISDLYLIGSQ
jgi:hypothetical protein